MPKMHKKWEFWVIFPFRGDIFLILEKNTKVSVSREFSKNFFYFLQILHPNCPQILKSIVCPLDQDFFYLALKTCRDIMQQDPKYCNEVNFFFGQPFYRVRISCMSSEISLNFHEIEFWDNGMNFCVSCLGCQFLPSNIFLHQNIFPFVVKM